MPATFTVVKRLLFLFAAICVVFFIANLVQSIGIGGIVIETKSIPELHAHQHDAGDSIMSPTHHELLTSNVFIPMRDLWIAGISGEITNAPPFTLHHGELLRLDAVGTGTGCPTAYGAGEILSFGQDQAHSPGFFFPDGYALFIPQGTPLVLAAMLHNPLPPLGPGETYRDIRARLTLHEATSTPLTPVSFKLLHLENVPCETTNMGYVFTVPPNTTDYVFKGGNVRGYAPASHTFERPTTIVYIGGHLHGWEGGRELRIYKNGELFTTLKTEKATDDPYRYDTPHYPASIHMEAGDTLSVEAVYDNPNDVPIVGAMGMLGIYYAEDALE